MRLSFVFASVTEWVQYTGTVRLAAGLVLKAIQSPNEK
jgi:hypothetical protein